MQTYGDVGGFALQNALFGLVSYNDPCGTFQILCAFVHPNLIRQGEPVSLEKYQRCLDFLLFQNLHMSLKWQHLPTFGIWHIYLHLVDVYRKCWQIYQSHGSYWYQLLQVVTKIDSPNGFGHVTSALKVGHKNGSSKGGHDMSRLEEPLKNLEGDWIPTKAMFPIINPSSTTFSDVESEGRSTYPWKIVIYWSP